MSESAQGWRLHALYVALGALVSAPLSGGAGAMYGVQAGGGLIERVARIEEVQKATFDWRGRADTAWYELSRELEVLQRLVGETKGRVDSNDRSLEATKHQRARIRKSVEGLIDRVSRAENEVEWLKGRQQRSHAPGVHEEG